MKIVDRYVIGHIGFSSLFALATCFFFFALGIVTALLHKEVSLLTIAVKLPSSLLVVLPYILPISLFLGTVLTFGKLDADGEIVALRAQGVPGLRLTAPALAVGVVFAAILFWLGQGAIPWAHEAKSDVKRAGMDALANARPSGPKTFDIADWLKIGFAGYDGDRFHNLVMQFRLADLTHLYLQAPTGAIHVGSDTIYLLCRDSVIYRLGKERSVPVGIGRADLDRRLAPEAWFDAMPIRASSPYVQFPIPFDTKGLKPASLESSQLAVSVKEIDYRRELCRLRLTHPDSAQCSHVAEPGCVHLSEVEKQTLAEVHSLSLQRGDKNFFRPPSGDRDTLRRLDKDLNSFRYQQLLRWVLPLSCIAFVLVGAGVPMVTKPGRHAMLNCVIGAGLLAVFFYPFIFLVKVVPPDTLWLGLGLTMAIGVGMQLKGGLQ